MKFMDKAWAAQMLRSDITILEPISDGTGINRGDSHQQRNGNKVHTKRLDIRGNIGWPAQNSATAQPIGKGQVKMFVVVDTQTNGVLMTDQDLLSQTVSTDFTKRFVNVSSGKRFKILLEKIYTIPAQEASAKNTDIVPAISLPIDECIDIRGYPIDYDYVSTGEVDHVTRNNVYIVMGSNQYEGTPSGTTEYVAYDLATRVWWAE